MSPCGLVVDLARSAYTVDVRFWSDSDQTVPVRWYRVPRDRPHLPYAHFLQMEKWNDDNGPRTTMSWGNVGQGEQQVARRWNNGRPPVPDPFNPALPHVCGTPEQWAGDLLIGRDPPLGPGDCPCLVRHLHFGARGGGVAGGWAAMRWHVFNPLIVGHGSGVVGGRCDRPDMTGRGSGVVGGRCTIPPADVDCTGSGLIGGVCDMTHSRVCLAHPDAPDTFFLDVTDIGSGDCPLPDWTTEPVYLPRSGTNPCSWGTGFTIPWDCPAGNLLAVGVGNTSLGRMRIDFRRASDGAVIASYFSAATTGAVPVVCSLSAGPFPDLTWPATLTLTS